MVAPHRNTAAKIAVFKEFFSGLEHVYGTHDPASGRSWQVKAPVTDAVIYRHLKGNRPYGVYLLTGESTRAAVADFDSHDANAPREFIGAAAHYGLAACLERSKSKGYHAWVFFQGGGAPAARARAVMRHMLDEIGCGPVEVFPKQDRIDPAAGQWGSFVNAPLFGRYVGEGRTVFVDPGNLKPFADQWEFLERVRRAPASLLDAIIEANGIAIVSPEPAVPRDRLVGTWQCAPGLPPCARRMLAEGVSEYQRLACFRLAVHLRRLGLPFDVAVAALEAWSARNRPEPGNRILTPVEIKAQTAFAYQKEYPGNACDQPEVRPFCSPACPIYPAVEAQRRNHHRIP